MKITNRQQLVAAVNAWYVRRVMFLRSISPLTALSGVRVKYHEPRPTYMPHQGQREMARRRV